MNTICRSIYIITLEIIYTIYKYTMQDLHGKTFSYVQILTLNNRWNQKMATLYHKYRATPACTSMQSHYFLYCWYWTQFKYPDGEIPLSLNGLFQTQSGHVHYKGSASLRLKQIYTEQHKTSLIIYKTWICLQIFVPIHSCIFTNIAWKINREKSKWRKANEYFFHHGLSWQHGLSWLTVWQYGLSLQCLNICQLHFY
jgi:hypothetical protein